MDRTDNTSGHAVSGQDVPFSFNELFFSRTDDRGIILSGNSVFQRISMYDWDELLRRPHNIIRHPDMPKAVFWLLWDTIKKREPIGAYVKNRAKDGRHYWVFAIVTPIEGGYLSVRLKPSGSFFSVVEKEYAGLVALESNRGLKPAESAQALLSKLAELGFTDYGAFMSAALSQVISLRDDQLGRPRDKVIECFDALVVAAKKILIQADQVYEAYSKNEYVPLNLRVQAAQLGENGATIGVISNNYSVISTEIKAGMDQFISEARQVFHTINQGLFLTGVAKIQCEVLVYFQQEAKDSEQNIQAQEMTYLEQQQNTYRHKATDGLIAIARQVEQFQSSCEEMKRLAAALEVTRIMGKVESSRLNVVKTGLNELISDLEGFQTSIADGLKEIQQVGREIQYEIETLLHSDA
jgi:PAS domain S-box-containing protein